MRIGVHNDDRFEWIMAKMCRQHSYIEITTAFRWHISEYARCGTIVWRFRLGGVTKRRRARRIMQNRKRNSFHLFVTSSTRSWINCCWSQANYVFINTPWLVTSQCNSRRVSGRHFNYSISAQASCACQRNVSLHNFMFPASFFAFQRLTYSGNVISVQFSTRQRCNYEKINSVKRIIPASLDCNELKLHDIRKQQTIKEWKKRKAQQK